MFLGHIDRAIEIKFIFGNLFWGKVLNLNSSHCLPQWEIHTPWLESDPHLLQLEKSLSSSEDPAQPKINILKKACRGFKNKRRQLAKQQQQQQKKNDLRCTYVRTITKKVSWETRLCCRKFSEGSQTWVQVWLHPLELSFTFSSVAGSYDQHQHLSKVLEIPSLWKLFAKMRSG